MLLEVEPMLSQRQNDFWFVWSIEEDVNADEGNERMKGKLSVHVRQGQLPNMDPPALRALNSPKSSYLLETLVSRCPESIFNLWTTYFERSLRKLAMHPVANFVIAKALERTNAEQLSYSVNGLWHSLSI
jgi:hypothetical protein